MANLTLCKNPFRPQIDREEVFVRAGTRLDTVLRNQGLISGRGKTLHRRHTFVVILNGQWLMQEQWARRVKADDSIGVLFVPGKGGGGSNPMQIVAMVTLAAATAGVGAWAAGAYAAAAGVAATSTAAIVVGAGVASLVAIGGGMLVSALFPPAKPPSVMAREQASPTYTIGAQGNTARLMESIPVQYGRFRAYPDFAAQPYTELAGNETYLYQLFCLGQGEYDIEEIRIEDTPISNFAEVQYEVVPPSGNVTLFPDNVVTSTAVQGLELKGTNEDGHAAIGPFVANPAGTTTTKLAVDIVLPAGLFYANDRGGLDARSVSWSVLAHPINDAGESTGPAITLGTETFSAGTNTPQMMTYRYDVPEGRYSVSAVRTSAKDTSSRAGNTLQWGGLRAYLPDHRDYGDVTLIAVVIRATNNLNQSTARRVNVISTRKLQTWHPANGWSFGVSATRNPAWALADVCRNQEYGRGLPDSRINLQALYRLSRIWDERGDSCDGRFDTATTLWDALTQIARTGRAMPMYYAGIIDFIRNEPKSVKTLMFTPNNIISNSFSVDYVFPQHDSPDYIIVEFFNKDTWQPDEVECALPGSAKQRPYRLQMPMVANRAQAWREGMSLAAQHRDQRRFVSFQTEMEGHIPRYGDLVEISHDVPAWGLSGFIESYDPSAKLLIATEPLSWWKGENHYINLRKRDGSPDGPYRVVAGAHEREMIIADAIDGYDVYVSNGQGEDFTHYQFGPGERRSLLAQVISTQPDESGNVSIDLVNYAPSVHSAENGGAVPPPGPSSLLPSMPNAPVIDSVIVYPTAITGQQIISATPARGAVHYEFRASDNDGQTWLDLGLHEKPSITVNLAVGTWRVQVRGIGVMHGPWANWVGPVSATMAPPPVLTLLSTKPLHWGLQLNWVWPSGINLTHIEVWISQTPHFLDAALLGLFPYPQTKHELGSLSLTSRLWFWARVRDEANQAGLWFPSESGAGVLGHPINDATEYNELVNQGIIANGLGELIMGNILDIPNIRDNVAEISIDLAALDGRVAEINAQVNELLGAAEWDAAQAYAVGTVVFHDGKMYRAKKAVPAGTPVSNTAHWDLIGDYASISDGLIALAIQAQETLNRVEQAEGQISAVSAKTDTLATKIDDPENGLTALSLSVHQLRTQVTQLQDGLTTLSEATTQLSSKVEGLEGAQDALSNAVQQLSTRVEQTEAGQRASAQQITSLSASIRAAADDEQALLEAALAAAQADINAQDGLKAAENRDLAAARAAQTLEQEVSRVDDEVKAVGRFATSLHGELNDAQRGINAQASAHQELKQEVTQIGEEVSAHSSDITQLKTVVNDPVTGLAATADGVNSLNIWAGLVDNKMVAQAQSIQSLTADIGTTQASVQTVSEAQNELDGRISASYAVKTAVNVNGVRYVTGFGLDTTTEGGVTQTTFAVVANRFVVMHDINGVPTAVFSVQGGASILNAALIGQASITEAKIANGSITRAKIANAAIGNAQIENGAITSAKIGDAQITTAKIGNAQVDTLRIANNSVGITAFTEAGFEMLNQDARDIYVGMNLPHAATVIVSVAMEGYSISAEPTLFTNHYVFQDGVAKKAFSTTAGYSPSRSNETNAGYVGYWVSPAYVSYVFHANAGYATFMLRQHPATRPWGGSRHFPPASIRIDAFMR